IELSPRPGKPHTQAATVLAEELGPPFKRGRGGPGGWIILYEPEIHFDDENIFVPDLAGWRRDRLPALRDDGPYFTLAPDGACEVLSKATARRYRVQKLAVYRTHAVPHIWLVDPIARVLEVFRLDGQRYSLLSTHGENDRVRAEPFDAIELDLGSLWQHVVV